MAAPDWISWPFSATRLSSALHPAARKWRPAPCGQATAPCGQATGQRHPYQQGALNRQEGGIPDWDATFLWPCRRLSVPDARRLSVPDARRLSAPGAPRLPPRWPAAWRGSSAPRRRGSARARRPRRRAAGSTSPVTTALPVLVVDPADADVQHDGAGLEVGCLDHVRHAGGGDDDVGLPQFGGRSTRAGVGQDDGGVDVPRVSSSPIGRPTVTPRPTTSTRLPFRSMPCRVSSSTQPVRRARQRGVHAAR